MRYIRHLGILRSVIQPLSIAPMIELPLAAVPFLALML